MPTQLLSREVSVVSSSQSATQVKDVKNKLGAYQADQQVKYLHLEAELDLLLQRVNILKSQA